MIETGYDLIPKPILEYVKNRNKKRPIIPHKYHVSSIVGCLVKEYYRRTIGGEIIAIPALLNMLRGTLFDEVFTPLFEKNQKRYDVTRGKITLTGQYDFVWDGSLWDLKIPKSVFFRKESGAGPHYINQGKTYLAFAHYHGDLLDVNKIRILMIAGDGVVRETVEGDDENIMNTMFARASAVDEDLARKKIKNILQFSVPEESWECGSQICFYGEMCPYKKN
ncbi:MAG: hypothetical protein QF381_01010 [Nitrososphaerales archaeon]|jgi:hypothetical protein|nr:hypothetical protein [Nitrososphaerales archaeon]|tara:strand:- start:1004 stop:1669 length:666 start_codon:yes stop_codon:yes gene_type:complete